MSSTLLSKLGLVKLERRKDMNSKVTEIVIYRLVVFEAVSQERDSQINGITTIGFIPAVGAAYISHLRGCK